MDQALDYPELAVFFFLARNNRRFRALEHGFDARHRIVPAKSKGATVLRPRALLKRRRAAERMQSETRDMLNQGTGKH